MGWGYSSSMYNSARIPALENYAQARDHYKSVVPIRGRTVECKPLGQNRRFTWFEITKNVNHYLSEDEPLGRLEDSYALKCGSNDLVEFFANGDIAIRQPSWHSPTSMGFLTWSIRHFGRIESYGYKWYFVNKKQQAYVLAPSDSELRIRPNEEGIYQPTAPIQEHKLFANRKELNRLRKLYKEFMDYTRTMLAMDERVSFDTGEALGFKGRHLTGNGYWGRNSAEDRVTFFNHLDDVLQTNDLTKMYSVAQYCANSFGGYRYNAQTTVCTPKEFERGFSDTLKYYHNATVFRRDAVPIGVPFRDTNQKYAG